MKKNRQFNRLAPLTYEYPAPGIDLAKSADQTLFIMAVHDGQLTTLDAWENCSKTVLASWLSGKPCLVLHDLHKSGILVFNDHMRDKFEALYRFRPDLERQVALVLPADLGLDVMARLAIKVRALTAPYGYAVQWEVFKKREQALQWLIQRHGKTTSSAQPAPRFWRRMH